MAAIELLVADATDLLLGALLGPQWGVYLNGAAVIQPATEFSQIITANLAPIQQIASLVGIPNLLPVTASTIEFEYAQEWPISNYPQEQGAFQAYNKTTLPFDVKLKIASGGPPSTLQAFLDTCLAIASSFSLFDIVTPETVFTSCNGTHIDWRRSAKNGATLIVVDLWFKQVPVVSATDFSNTASPTAAGQQNIGNVQTVTPPQSVQQNFGVNGNWTIQ